MANNLSGSHRGVINRRGAHRGNRLCRSSNRWLADRDPIHASLPNAHKPFGTEKNVDLYVYVLHA
jgi:hypothetical protein